MLTNPCITINERSCIIFYKETKSKGAFHLSELTAQQPIPLVMRISLLIKTNHTYESNPEKLLGITEMVFQQNLFHC